MANERMYYAVRVKDGLLIANGYWPLRARTARGRLRAISTRIATLHREFPDAQEYEVTIVKERV